MSGRELRAITVLVGGTLLTIVLPAAISTVLLVLAVRGGRPGPVAMQVIFTMMQALAIVIAYRARSAHLLPVLLPSLVAGLQLLMSLLLR